jgi:hypothetical protein
VSQLLIPQPFVNYNVADGWYLVSSPIIAANWEADSDDTWTVPLGREQSLDPWTPSCPSLAKCCLSELCLSTTGIGLRPDIRPGFDLCGR